MSSPKLLAVKPFRQTAGLCGPASLKIALSYFGREYSENHLAELSAATTQHGTEHADLIKAVQQLGGSVITNEHASVSDVESLVVNQKLPVIIGWFDGDEDHYSVVVGVTPKYLITQDPAVGGIRRLSKSIFPAIWFDFVGPENKTVSWGWYMAINFPPLTTSPI
jgi:ABC-type bacteriocin/lantibiotic exporter with double-glycine peptidase domain